MKYFKKLLVSLTLLALTINSNAQLWQKSDIDKIAISIAEQQLAAERKLYKAVPDPINCKKTRWMEPNKCADLNFIMKKNPGAPIRMTAKNGQEVNLAPATPAAMIPFILDPSIENAIAMEKFNRAMFNDAREKSLKSSVVTEILKQTGQVPQIDDNPYNFSINESEVRITLLLDPAQSTSESLLQNIQSAREHYPNLNVKAYYRNNSTRIRQLNSLYGISGRAMSAGETLKSGINIFPVVWVDSVSHNFRRTIQGVPTIPRLMKIVEIVSNVHLAKDLLGGRK